ncbi:MAG: hypothetical protein H7124_04170 [Phycisphaerales bacterium]|nr:hypothetical protein [Hyphomonadaceae bacterium]
MTLNPAQTEAGRGAALAVYVLYLLSIPSFAVLALIGVILAYASRDGAGPLARSHLDDQIRIWWAAFWWSVGVAILAGIGVLLVVVLIGIPIMWLAGLIGFIVFIWFTIKALLGLLALLDGRAR